MSGRGGCLKQCAMDQLVCSVVLWGELPLRRHLPHSLSEKKSTGGRVNPLQTGPVWKDPFRVRGKPSILSLSLSLSLSLHYRGGMMYKTAREGRAEDERSLRLEATMRRSVKRSSKTYLRVRDTRMEMSDVLPTATIHAKERAK